MLQGGVKPGNSVSEAYETIVGKVCIERGWVTREQLVGCLRECGSAMDDLSTPGTGSRLTDMLVSRGLVKQDQMSALREEVSRILANSSSYTVVRKGDASLGQLLVKGGQLKKEHLIEALSIQQFTASKGGTVPRLGEVLISKGYSSFKSIQDALNSQKEKTPLQCASCQAAYQVVDFDPKKKYLCKKCTGPLLPPGQAQSDIPEEVAKASQNEKNMLGKYIAVKELGRGGMGAVYKAWDQPLKRWVAIKVLIGTGAKDEIARFRREAQTAAALRHPNIVGIFEVTSVGDKHIIAMEYIDGKSLAGLKMAAIKAAEILGEVCQAVEYAHSRGIIHRDIKPHNVMIDTEGKPYVMDFGLAKSLQHESHITMQGTVVGTPSYMSPEQAEGRISQVDKQSDVYSLGAVLFECLTGRPPFKGTSPIDTMKMVVNDDVRPPTELNSAVPKDLETIVLKALEKDKRLRYASAKAMADDLQKFAGGREIRAKRAPVAAKLARQMKRQWAPLAAIAAVTLIAILAAVLIAGSGGKDKEVATLLRAGNKLASAGDWNAALVKFESALALDPSNSEVLQRVEDANRETKKALDSEKYQRDALVRKTEEERKRKDDARKAAQPAFDNASNAFKKGRTDLYRQINDLSKIDQELQEAIDHCGKAIAIFPEHHEAYHLRGQAYYLRQYYAEAEKDFTAAIGFLNTFSAAYYDRGRVYLDLASEAAGQSGLRGTSGDDEPKALREKAKADFQAYKTNGGGDPEQMEIAAALIAVSETAYDRASQICDGLIQKQTNNEEVYKVKGDALFEEAHGPRPSPQRPTLYRDSIKAYTDAIARRVNYPEAYLGRGHALAHVGDREAATRDLDKAMPIGRGSGGWFSARGLVLYELGRRPEAIRDFESALAVRPNDTAAMNNLGWLYYQQREDRRALDLFNRVLKLDSKNSLALAYRGLVHSLIGDTGQALADLEASLALDPKGSQVYLYRATVYNVRREWSKSEDDCTRYIAAFPSSAEGYFHRGAARYGLEKFQEAIADWAEMAKLDPKRKDDADKRIAQARQRLGQ
jgi:tetratricopeptide (TPR) repeat protein/predicted Ser/Thr protein kinase